MESPPHAAAMYARIERFARYLKSENKSDNTIRIYRHAATKLADWLVQNKIAADWSEVTGEDIEDFRGSMFDAGAAPGYVHNIHRSLKAFFAYVTEKTKIPNPMAEVKPPILPEQLIDIVEPKQLAALIKSCDGKGFVPRRDLAIITMFMDLGLRRHELTGLHVADLDLDNHTVTVRADIAKNRKVRFVQYGSGTARIIDDYLDERDRHPRHGEPELWLGEKGKKPMTDSGIYQMLERRGNKVGITKLYPHRLRHTWVHLMKEANMQPDEIQAMAGWNGPAMLTRYGASTTSKRGQKSMRRLSPVDRLKRGELK